MHKLKYFVVGFGSNCVIKDGEIDTIFICLKNMNKIYLKNKKIIAYAGANLFTLNHFCEQNSCGGLEFSYGIPGSIGGAVVMNAGAYEKEFKNIVSRVWMLNMGRVVVYDNRQLNFGYRTSHIKQQNANGQNLIVLKAEIKTNFCSSEQIKKLQDFYFEKRLNSQPYNAKSCGSVFKKCKGQSAGKLIESLGLKGTTIGKLIISPKHANFFVNQGEATFKNFCDMLKLTKQKVKEQLGETLEEEVCLVQ